MPILAASRPPMCRSVVTLLLSTALTAGCAGGAHEKPRPEVPFVPAATGCDGAALLERPADTGARGPWPVGTRRVKVGRLDVDVFYPAERGSDFDVPATTFDIREFLPPSQRQVVPDARAPIQRCDCHRDLPVDRAHGPWPVVVFVHGTASFSTQSLSDVTHWASRGFVVLAATHPALCLADTLAFFCSEPGSGDGDLAGDLSTLLGAARAPATELAFLNGALDARFAIVGHSAGANAAVAAGIADAVGDVKAVVSLAGNAAYTAMGASFLGLGGTSDAIVRLTASEDAYRGSSTPRRFVTLEKAGHLAFSDLCETRNADGENLLAIAQAEGLCGADLAGFLFDCSPDKQDPALSRAIVRTATTWVLEERLHCATPLRTFTDEVGALPGVVSAVEDLASSP